jgi:hypothetical protein
LEFYQVENGEKLVYSPGKKKYISLLPVTHAFIVMRILKIRRLKNSAPFLSCGDEVLGLKWYANSDGGGEVLEEYKGPSARRRK